MLIKMISGNDTDNLSPNKNNQTHYYPDVFFTQSYMNGNKTTTNTQTNNETFRNTLSPEIIKKILPILLTKGKKIDMAELLSMVNPQLAEIMSLTKSFKEDNKSEHDNNNKASLIDMSEYTEIS